MRQLLAEAEAKLRLTQRRCGVHGQANEAPSPLHAHPQPPQLQSVPEYNPPAETGISSHLEQLEGQGQLFYASGTARPRAERDLSAFTAHFPDQYLRCDKQSVCMPPPFTMAIPCHAKATSAYCSLYPLCARSSQMQRALSCCMRSPASKKSLMTQLHGWLILFQGACVRRANHLPPDLLHLLGPRRRPSN